MPAQVVVVRRPRRGLFAAPRALPDLLRSLVAAWREPSPSPSPSSATAAAAAPIAPRLVRDGSGEHRCVACRRCVDVCPSGCLSLEGETSTGEGAPSHPHRFELVAGACIGCAECVAVCPERALEMASGARVEAAGFRASEAPVRDLLAVAE